MGPKKEKERKMLAPQSAGSGKTWKQTPLRLATALLVMVFAVVIHTKGSTSATEAAAVAVVGAAAGVGSHSLWKAEPRTAAVAITAVAGAIGTAAATLRSLEVIQSLIESAVIGAMVGAAITAIAKTQLQWALSMINGKEAKQTFPGPSVSGRLESATESSGLEAVQERPAVPGQMIEIYGGLLETGVKSAMFGSSQTQKVTDQSAKRDGSPQINESPQMEGANQTMEISQTDRSPQTDVGHQINEHPQTDRSPYTILSSEIDATHQTNEFPQIDGSPQADVGNQTNELPQTDRSPYTILSPEIDATHQTNEFPQIDGSPQADVGHQTNELPQTDRSPYTILSPEIDVTHQINELSQIDGSPQTGVGHQTNELPQTGGSPKTIESPPTDKAHQTTEFPQTDGSPQTIQSPEMDDAHQTNEFAQIDGSPETIESPRGDGAHQTNEFLHTDGSPQTFESPQIDRALQTNDFPQTGGSLQTFESPPTYKVHQTTEFPQTDGSPQIIQSPEMDDAHQTNTFPQIDGSPKTTEDGAHLTNEFLQTNGSPQKIESPQTDRALQTDRFPQTIESPQVDGAQQTNECPLIDGSPRTDLSLQLNESLKLDETHQTHPVPKTDGSPHVNQLPETNMSLQKHLSKTNTTETEKTTQNKQFPRFQESYESSKAEPAVKDSKPTDYTKNTGRAKAETDQCTQQENYEKQKLFERLYLKKNDQLKAADVLQITKHTLQTLESCTKEKLVQTFIQKLLMMDYRARYIQVKQKTDTGLTKLCGDIFTAMSLSIEATSQSDRIHPMDVQMAVFHCADGFLKQMMVTKLSQCQFALPLLVPDPFRQQVEFPLWTFRKIKKSWKMRNAKNEIISQTQPVYKAQTPMVFFFRFGSMSSSKSHLMNGLINDKHNTFFHRNCPGSSRSRVLMDGVVEIAWFCPSGKSTDKFNDCVAFCNLHGDAGDHEKQLNILNEKASVNVVLLPQLDSNSRDAAIIQNLFANKKPLICLFTEDESVAIEIGKGKFKIGLKYRNQSDISEELRGAINRCLLESSTRFRLDAFQHPDIRDDVEQNEDCKRGREAAEQMMNLLKEKNLTEIKESFLPHQGKLWHQWSKKNKDLHRPQGDELEKEISSKKTEMMKIRKQQHESDISEFMKNFMKTMSSDAKHEKVFFLKWLTTLLDEHISDDVTGLQNKYNKTWSRIVELKDQKASNGKPEQLKGELEKISQDLQAAAFGLEHIMREISQIYESCLSVNDHKEDLPVDFSSLPSLAAEMMMSGFPLELMDGDAAHVPVVWISAVLDHLIQKLGDQRVFVLSVLGIQSSGKSTMLNAMFGLQFAVSAGRCTRGAFMQLLKVSDEMKTELKSDYILVVDTEGLRSLELAGKSTRKHDNELATFVVGLGNLTLINIFGENPAEMQDILQIVVQAFLRMKVVRLNPRCVFVHQNVSDVTAGEKNMEGKRRLQETLDEMTKLAAKDEVCDAETFSDVISFDVQKDVKYFAQLWEGSPPMAPPNPNYCENVQELKKSIAFYASRSPGIKLTHLKDRIKDLWEALLNERFVFSFRNSLEISAYKKLETKYSKWSWKLRSAMLETENKLHNKIENEAIQEVEDTHLNGELRTTREEVKKSMSEFFEKDTDAEILIQWKASFEIKIKEVQENIVRETTKKLNEIIKQLDLKKKIDAQRTHHENTLYEKSKELALKLKDRTNDEEKLKMEFHSFWEQSVKETIRDAPEIKDIDIMRDVKKLLCDIYGSASVDHWKDTINFFNVESYNDYVKMKTSGLSNPIQYAKEKFGYRLSREDESQIRSLVTDIAQQTIKMIQSFNISKMGYNKSCLQQLTDNISARLRKHEKENMKYEFKNEFFMNLVLSICNGSNKIFTDQQRLFREANDPVLYVEKKRDEYYRIFQKHIRGTASAAIFGEIISQKLKEPIEQSVYKKTSRQLADEMTTNCPSLNGNRSKLEKHILKTLAKEEEFYQLKNYVINPRDHFKSFIREEVRQYIADNFGVSVLPKMKENIKLLQEEIIKAAHESTVKAKGQNVGLWLKSFRQHLSGELIFSEKDLSGYKHDDVDDFRLIEEVIGRELSTITPGIIRTINKEIFEQKLDFKFRPDELLINHFCQCCWVQCPFCAAICTNTIEKHDGDHSVPFHRVDGINGWHYSKTKHLCADFCTTLVTSAKTFKNGCFQCKDYRKAGGVYAEWSITPDLSELPYWKWIVCRFQTDLENHYNMTFDGCGKIPDEWREYSKKDAIESLDRCFGSNI